jgi:hypothetical protein
MYKIDRPTKQQVRDWLMRRHINPEPLPLMEQIRHELHWKLDRKEPNAMNLWRLCR